MVMKNFDLQRFVRVLRLDFAAGWQQLLWCLLAMLMGYLFFFWFAYNIGMKVDTVDDWESYIKSVCEGVSAFSVISWYFYCLATASTLYHGEQKKAKRMAWLMLPATNVEKFLSRWGYMLAVALGGFLMFFVADAIHAAWLWLSGKPVIAATPHFLAIFPQTSNFGPHETWVNVLSLYSVLIAGHAFFLLGGIFFRRFQPVVTAIVGITLFLVIAHFITHDQPYLRGIPYVWYHGAATVFFAALACVFTVLSYRLFCRWQIATFNFVNLP